MKKVKQICVFFLGFILIASATVYSIPAKAETSTELIDTNVYKLSSSKLTTTGTINAGSNILKVTSVADFEVGQGIAIADLEPISDFDDDDGYVIPNYTWFVAKIREIDASTGEIALNREAPISITEPVAVKHDNYYVFCDIVNEYDNSDSIDIKIPYGEYEVNAVHVQDTTLPRINSKDLNTNDGVTNDPGTNNGIKKSLFRFEEKEKVSIDFSNSTIKLNGDVHLGPDYRFEDKVQCRSGPVELISIVRSKNVTISNLNADGGGLAATRSTNLNGDGQFYGISLNGVDDCIVSNVRLTHFLTDGMIVTSSPVVSADGTRAPCTNVLLDGVIADANCRQGLTVGGVKGINIINSKFMNTGMIGAHGGRPPMAGIAFEIESNTIIEDISMDNVVFYNNPGRSIHFYNLHKPLNINLNNILSYQPEGITHFCFLDAASGMENITVTNSNFINKPQPENTSAQTDSFYNSDTSPNRKISFENCNFLGSIKLSFRLSNVFYNDCNFFMESDSQLRSTNNYVNLNRCMFYVTKKPTNTLFDPGFQFNDCIVYNAIPTTQTRLDLTTATGTNPTRLNLFNNTSFIGNIGISQIEPNVSENTDVSNKIISTRAGSNISTIISASADIPQEDIGAVEDELTGIRQDMLQKISDSVYEPYHMVTGVSLDKSAVSMVVGNTVSLVASITPGNVANKNVSWGSSNTNVATVDTSGLVTAKASGTAVITVITEDGLKTASCTVTVDAGTFTNKYQETDPNIKYSSGWTLKNAGTRYFDGGSAMMCKTAGETIDFTVNGSAFRIISYKAYTQGKFDVAIDGVTVAKDISLYSNTIDTEVKIPVYSAVMTPGKHNITITHSGKEAIATGSNVYLDAIETDGTIEPRVPVSGVTLDKSAARVTVGETETLTATVNPGNATNQSVTWSSSNESVATVDNQGIVTGISAGTATITAKSVDGGYTASCTVTVIEKPLTLTRYQETDPNLHFEGSWTDRAFPQFGGGSAKQTSIQGDTLTFSFKGKGFAIISYRSYSQGMADVYVDDVLQETPIDLYEPGADTSFNQTVYEDYSWGDGQAHTVKLVLNGKNPMSIGYNVYIDAVEICGNFVELGVLEDDEATTAGNTNPVIIDVQANDVTKGTIHIESQPANGKAVAKYGVVVYTPTTMLLGDDTFTYSVEGKAGTATVTVKYLSPMLYQEDFETITSEGFSPLYNKLFTDGKAAATKNGTMEFTFEGSGFEILGYKSVSRGVFYVTVDGGTPARVSCFDNSYDTWIGAVYKAENLGEGTHTVKIEAKNEKDAIATGTQVDIDAIRTFR